MHHEAEEWPDEFLVGVLIPLWKGKGSKEDMGTYRGVVLLSVGTKLLARIVATRAKKWLEPILLKELNGFCKGRGVDDVLQVSRRICEEVAFGEGGGKVVMKFYDIEKAYPRVCREALWESMELWGPTRNS